MLTKFRDYVLLRELDEKDPERKTAGVHSSIVLGKDNDFKPFIVAGDERNPAWPVNKNLSPIVKAFKDSRKVTVYGSLGKDGEAKPHTLGAKQLFLVGGAVRDHLKGKTPHDMDLATDATPDEIRMILVDAGFAELKKDRPAAGAAGGKAFYVKGRDKSGGEFVFGVKVGGQEFDLATFRKDSHGSDGRAPDKMSFGGHADDAARRDLTMNSLYLSLTNDDGPNNQVTDFHGGVHDLVTQNARFVGKPEERLEEDLLRALRYARFAAAYGGGKTSPEVEKAIAKVSPRIRVAVSPDRIQDEFVKGLKNEDVDPAKLVQIYKKLGLLDVVFPNMKIKLDSQEDYPRDRDPAVVVASLLRGNDPAEVERNLRDGRWSGPDIARVAFLHKILSMNQHMSPEELDSHLNAYNRSNLVGRSVESWWSQNKKGQPEVMKAFLAAAKGPRVQALAVDGDTGERSVDPAFADLFDKVTMKPVPGMERMVGARKRAKEHENFLSLYRNGQ